VAWSGRDPPRWYTRGQGSCSKSPGEAGVQRLMPNLSGMGLEAAERSVHGWFVVTGPAAVVCKRAGVGWVFGPKPETERRWLGFGCAGGNRWLRCWLGRLFNNMCGGGVLGHKPENRVAGSWFWARCWKWRLRAIG
jgi:hypothetical protein